MKLAAYVDGSCSPNPGRGAYGVVIIDEEEGREICRFTGVEESSTNNRVEILGAIRAAYLMPSDVPTTIYSDSSLVVNTMSLNWKRNHNTDLWDTLDKAIKGKKISFVWVKGHNGSKFNEIANTIAREATKKP